MSRVHELQQEVREPIEIGQSSQVARVSKKMARDHQRSTCQRSFCAGIEFIPAKVKVIDYYRESFQCLACRKEAHFSIEKPAMERDHPAKL